MALIGLEGIHFHRSHGFYNEEQIIGNEFVLDVFIDTNTAPASVEDDLFLTINYETVYHLCVSEMKKTSKLIETIAQNILLRILAQFGQERISGIKVKVKKLNPPVGGRVDSASIELTHGTLDPSNQMNALLSHLFSNDE